MPSISGTLTSQAATALSQATFPQNRSSFHKNPGTSSSGSMDPFSEAAYQEWVSSIGLQQQQQQHTIEPQEIWPSAITRNSSKQLGDDTSMPRLPDYLSHTILGQSMETDPMSLSGPSLDEDGTMGSLKVPTNTPTTFVGGIHGASDVSGLCSNSFRHPADKWLTAYRSFRLQHPQSSRFRRAC